MIDEATDTVTAAIAASAKGNGYAPVKVAERSAPGTATARPPDRARFTVLKEPARASWET